MVSNRRLSPLRTTFATPCRLSGFTWSVEMLMNGFKAVKCGLLVSCKNMSRLQPTISGWRSDMQTTWCFRLLSPVQLFQVSAARSGRIFCLGSQSRCSQIASFFFSLSQVRCFSSRQQGRHHCHRDNFRFLLSLRAMTSTGCYEQGVMSFCHPLEADFFRSVGICAINSISIHINVIMIWWG